MTYSAYVINCDIHADRLKSMHAQLQKANIQATRVPCINGRKFSTEVLCAMRKRGLITNDSQVNVIEIAICLSHYSVWLRLLQSSDDCALVFEDDCMLHDGFKHRLESVLSSLDDFSILFLWNGNWGQTRRKLTTVGTVGDVVVKQEHSAYNAGAVSYVISRPFAQYMVKHFFPIMYPVDITIGDHFRQGRHLTLDTVKVGRCLQSKLLTTPCDGEFGTGNSTQDYSRPSIDDAPLKCPRVSTELPSDVRAITEK